MNEVINKITESFTINETLSDSQFSEWELKINLKFAADYLGYMKERNGGEGAIGSEGYVRFWPFQELIEANEDYSVSEFAPGLFFIGTDGGDTAYGIRRETGVFIEVPFIGMSDDEAIIRGENFLEFLLFLSK